MMKTKKWMRTAIFAVLAVVATACTDNDLIDKDVNHTPDITDGKMTIHAATGDEAANTRVAYEDAKGKLTWQTGDRLTVALMKGGKVVKQETDFLFNGKDGDRSGSFTGTAIEMVEGGTWSIYYPNTVTVDPNNGNATLSMMRQTQTANDNTDHLRNYILLGATGISNLNAGCALTMQSSIMKFVLSGDDLAQVGKLTNLVWMVETDAGTRSISLGFAPGAVTLDASNKTLTAYLSFMPQDMMVKSGGKFTVMLTGDKTYMTEITVSNEKTYDAGKRYTATIDGNTTKWEEKVIMALTVKVGDNQGFNIPFSSDGITSTPAKLTVDWGDGGLTEVASGTALTKNDDFNHTYSAAGTYTITITSDQTDETQPQIPAFNFPNNRRTNKNPTKLISIDTPLLNTAAKDFSSCFSECTALQSIPPGLFDKNEMIESFRNSFNACSALKEIPSGLFNENTKVTTFRSCFNGCTALKEIPSGLFNENTQVTTFQDCFSGCTALKEIPSGLFDKNTEAKDFSGCFSRCTALQSIPSGLFDKNEMIESFQSGFSECSSLKEIPSGLFNENTQVTTFTSCFQKCSALKEIPTGLFDNNTKATSFQNCFLDCSALKEIPTGLFDKNTAATNFISCFQNCSALHSIPEGLFNNNSNAFSFNHCFNGCTHLVLNSYIFSNDGNINRFSGKPMYFASCFQNVGSKLDKNKGGTAPNLWDYIGVTWGTIGNCFAGATNLDNYKDIPNNWKGL